MKDRYKVLIMGASYGSLLGTKIAMAGHDVTMVCLSAEAEQFNAFGAIIRTPVKGHEGLIEINSIGLPGNLNAAGTGDVDPADFDLVALAMQEPQYGAPGVRELLDKVALSRVPCMSIMNMPPLPYLKRIPGLDVEACRACFTAPEVWDNFDPDLMTLCSPDPQAFRPPEEPLNVLQVRLPTNFKASRFPSEAHTDMLRQLQADIQAVRFETMDGPIEVPVKLKVYDSVFVPLAKWAMLLAGNYRCVQAKEMRSIMDSVHADIDVTRDVYEGVAALCIALGADASEMVPFEKYANAAKSLGSPSSAARALASGAKNIERVDKLVQIAAAQKAIKLDAVDETVSLVDSWLCANRQQKPLSA